MMVALQHSKGRRHGDEVATDCGRNNDGAQVGRVRGLVGGGGKAAARKAVRVARRQVRLANNTAGASQQGSYAPPAGHLAGHEAQRLHCSVRVGFSPEYFTNAIGVGAQFLNDTGERFSLLVHDVGCNSLIKRQGFAFNRDFVQFNTRDWVFSDCHGNILSWHVWPIFGTCKFLGPWLAALCTGGAASPTGSAPCSVGPATTSWVIRTLSVKLYVSVENFCATVALSITQFPKKNADRKVCLNALSVLECGQGNLARVVTPRLTRAFSYSHREHARKGRSEVQYVN